jgi:hypothetical protein
LACLPGRVDVDAMFLRFVITRRDEHSRSAQGVFVAAHELLRSGDLNPQEWKHLRSLLDDFNKSLPHPPDNFYASRAIFWFKASAHENIRRIWELVHLLRAHGNHVEVYKCRHLANISYQDEMQVAAYPSERDGRITAQ